MNFFQFFENLISSVQKSTKPQQKAWLKLQGDHMTFWRQGYERQFDLSELRKVSGSVYPTSIGSGLSVFVNLTNQNTTIYVPSDADGFSDLLNYLQNKYQIAASQFDFLIQEYPNENRLLWQRYDYTKSAILDAKDPESLRKNLWQGFQCFDQPEIVIAWNKKITDFEILDFVDLSAGERGLPHYIRFEKKIILGNLVLEDFTITVLQSRNDTPPKNYQANILIENPGQHNYYLPKECLEKVLGVPATCHESKEALTAVWNWEGLEIKLSFYFDGPTNEGSGHCFFYLTNDRSYPECWLSVAHEWNFEVTESMYLNKNFPIYFDWRNNPYVVPTPEGIQRSDIYPDKPYIIWRDDSTKRFGFANSINAVIIPQEKLISLNREVWMPDKGESAERLIAQVEHDGEQIWIVVADGSLDDFKPYVDKIERFLQRKVTVSNPWGY